MNFAFLFKSRNARNLIALAIKVSTWRRVGWKEMLIILKNFCYRVFKSLRKNKKKQMKARNVFSNI